MTKKIISVLAVIFILSLSFTSVYAEPNDDSALSDSDIITEDEAQDAEPEESADVQELSPEEVEAMLEQAEQPAEPSEEELKKENDEKAKNGALYIKDVSLEKDMLTITVANKADFDILEAYVSLAFDNSKVSEKATDEAAENLFVQDFNIDEVMDGKRIVINYDTFDQMTGTTSPVTALNRINIIDGLKSGEEKQILCKVDLAEGLNNKDIILDASFEYIDDMTVVNVNDGYAMVSYTLYDILNEDYKSFAESTADSAAGSTEEISKSDAIMNFLKQTGFSMTNWQSLVMILIACLLFYLAIVKKFEPLLLLPIAFGMLLTNLMGAEVFHEELFAGGHVHWDMFGGSGDITPGLIDILYLGVKLGIYPCLIFIGVGAMTDFGPLIANPKSLLLGAAAQVGIFATFLGALALGFTQQQAGSIGIIGGADGPTAIFVTSKLAPELLGPIAVAAYSYMALVPVIQPPIMKLLTSKKERQIEMKALRTVSQKEKIVFPIVVTIFVALLVPSAAPLVGCLMLGNLLKECGVCERLSKTVQNELMNIVTVFLGISVGATATASTFLSFETIKIIVMGVVAFGVATACGVLLAKFMNLFLKNKINPLIGSAGVSAVPMAARVSQVVGQKENPSNFLLMHAMGPNVAGVIGSAIAAGALIAMLG